MNSDRALRASIAAATGLAIAFGPVAGVAVADPVVAADTAFDRSVGLQGVQNARDVGGYRTVDGRLVRTGLVYRTGQLNDATPADLAALDEREVRVVTDLRTRYERAIAPDRVPAGAVDRWDDVIGQASPKVLITALTGGSDLYRAFVTAPGANAAFASVLRDVIETGDGAVLYHCTAGKDRTGWATAVLLTLLGVDRATVTEDYLLSNQYRDAGPNDPLDGVQSAWLDAAFDQVNQTHGGFEAYVRDGLGLTDADIAALRAKMLA
ncbi:tyrosine-protein phosphatase [Nocardia amikacinitolerans]|uniref:tyrosine-protein phosphatase n=1 Tax=Nocardia amikacinitolerans TaxID=756689 RepID=UPI0020A47FA6|nr:tyrosine-protein phosphatase [Nocardia amikacinitolerans]MCP2287787.1 protein-tyrosine phosphatase [Nocardia amikacinitolerans]